MSRKKDKKAKEKDEETRNFDEFRLHPETKKSVFGIIFLGAAAILILAKFQSAGPFGKFVYDLIEKFFGWGYYFLFLTLLAIAGVFLTSERRKIYQITLFGASLFVLSCLGLIDIVFPEKGGLVGSLVGLMEIPFGYAASIVIAVFLGLIALLITFNLPLKIKNPNVALEKIRGTRPVDIKGIPQSSDAGEEVSEEESEKEIEGEDEGGENEEDSDEIKNEDIKVKDGVFSGFGLARGKSKPQNHHLKANYKAPPFDLLKSSVERPTSGDLRANANIIKRTLESFGIAVEMGEISIGPKVTRYTLKPAEGVKLSKITALNQDLSLALAAHPIRIEAPIPGKSLVGIEVPNKSAAIVRLGSLVNYPEFNESGPLGFILGRDVSGEPIFSAINKMPHLLVAGSTGSGKSIAIHSLLISLLYKNSPEFLRMVLIDPKRVELSIYDGLPHLVAPVITQAKKSMSVFRWAIDEMDKRYEILLKSGSRDIQSYNKKNGNEPLPYILIVIDELADLMASYGREIEGAIVRLAQMARATGIHLVLATQRPSVDVITGLIKANITSRIALQVASQVDSRTILDAAGAEKLLGGGDMLFISSELSKPKRIQGAYVSEEEIKKVVEYVKENNKDFVFSGDEEGLNFDDNGNNQPGGGKNFLDDYDKADSEEDELYEEAVEVVKLAGKASASLLQRRLKVGYARAARLLDIMENNGIIGPGEGAKPREVYVNKQ